MQLAKQRNVQVIRGRGEFIAPHHIKVETAAGEVSVSFDNAIVAAGSQPVCIPPPSRNDPRIMDSTGALALADVPGKFLIIGGGIIGLEMATVYRRPGQQDHRGGPRRPVDPWLRQETSCGRCTRRSSNFTKSSSRPA